MDTQTKHYQPHNKEGFALIATISIMVLLVMIALAMLSLSTIELRQKTNISHQQRAQANARMAAMMALAQLQEKLGADQRVTATADIVSDTVSVHKKNWTTVWNTSSWDPQDPNATRDSAYMGALVSGGEYSLATDRGSATTTLAEAVPTSDPKWIALVAGGSVNDDDDYVYAPKVDVLDTEGEIAGAYAYWVGDQGVKARIDVGGDASSAANTWASAGKLGTAPGTGVHKVTGLSAYSNYLPSGDDSDDLAKFMSYRTFDLSKLDLDELKDNYHHLTTSHTGLLVDNRRGGIRRDLSTAFEIDPEDFSDIKEFNNSGETNNTEEYTTFVPADVTSNPLYYHNGTDPELGFLYEVPVNNTDRYRGPTWDLLRNHYRIYKKERNALNFRGLPTPGDGALAAHGVVPFSYAGDPNANFGASLGSVYTHQHKNGVQHPFVSAHGKTGGHDCLNGDRMQPTVQKITPELIRAVLVFGLAREGDTFYMTATPYFTFHNPYNYPLEFYSLSVDMRAIGSYIKFKIEYTDIDGNERPTKEEEENEEFNLVYRPVSTSGLKALSSYRLEPSASGLHRLEPGEIKMMSMQPNADIAAANGSTIRLTEFKYNEENGRVSGTPNTYEVKPESEMTVKMRFFATSFTIPNIFVRLYHPERATGGSYVIDDPSTFSDNNADINRHKDTEPLSLIKHMRIWPKTEWVMDDDGKVEERTFNEDQVTTPAEGYLPLYALDMKMKTFQDDVSIMGDFNYRSLGQCPRDHDADDAIAPNWNMSARPIGDYSGLQLTDDAANATGYWGPSHEAGSGESKIVIFDLPRTPSVSLASLQHADTSKLPLHPMHSIARSRPQLGQADLTQIFTDPQGNTRGGATSKDQIDTAWAANEALWDRYYYSGINWGDEAGQPYATQTEAVQAIIDGKNDVFANSRIQLMKPVAADDLAELTGSDAYAKIGHFLGIKGAFNVNSTSEEAWKAVLASLSGHEISYLSGSNLTASTLDNKLSPISRFSTPAGDEDDDYMGFRALTDAELSDLAVEMVNQVRLRGPFMGLSDFVNRRLLDGETGKAGAIQAAIDLADLNSSVSAGSTSDPALKHSAPDINEGMARHFSQGDILNSLAPIMTTRSDTFVIRAYGDSKDASGDIKATAWCELVVQRTPEWVVPTSEEATIQNPNYPEQNSTDEPILQKWQENPNLPVLCQTFGRKFKVQSFRWLSAQEL